MDATPRQRSAKGYLATGIGALIAGVGTYLAAALSDPASDVSRTQFLTLDAQHELELEGVTILFFLVVAGAAAVIGCWLSLWLLRYPYSFLTAVIFGFVLFCGAMPIEELSTTRLFRSLPEASLAWTFALWPLVAGIGARGIVIGILRGSATRLPDVRPRGITNWP